MALFCVDCARVPMISGMLARQSQPKNQSTGGPIRPLSALIPSGLACKPLSGSRPYEMAIFRKFNNNNELRVLLDHTCVLNVQHRFENHCRLPVWDRSCVASRNTIGNCLRATEGGIPKSSRKVVRLSPSRLAGVSERRERPAVSEGPREPIVG